LYSELAAVQEITMSNNGFIGRSSLTSLGLRTKYTRGKHTQGGHKV
jgi:hypothetical protein